MLEHRSLSKKSRSSRALPNDHNHDLPEGYLEDSREYEAEEWIHSIGKMCVLDSAHIVLRHRPLVTR